MLGFVGVWSVTSQPLNEQHCFSAEKDAKGPLDFVQQFLSTSHVGYRMRPGGHILVAVGQAGSGGLQGPKQGRVGLTEDGARWAGPASATAAAPVSICSALCPTEAAHTELSPGACLKDG